VIMTPMLSMNHRSGASVNASPSVALRPKLIHPRAEPRLP
jgi:hypothetical protein